MQTMGVCGDVGFLPHVISLYFLMRVFVVEGSLIDMTLLMKLGMIRGSELNLKNLDQI